MCSLMNMFSMASNDDFWKRMYESFQAQKQKQKDILFTTDDLKDLVKDHINPICIITGHLLNEPDIFIDTIS